LTINPYLLYSKSNEFQYKKGQYFSGTPSIQLDGWFLYLNILNNNFNLSTSPQMAGFLICTLQLNKKIMEKIKKIFLITGVIMFILILLLTALCYWIYVSIYKLIFPKKWEQEQAKEKGLFNSQTLNRGWACQPNIFGEH
jgi:hypothetical protein